MRTRSSFGIGSSEGSSSPGRATSSVASTLVDAGLESSVSVDSAAVPDPDEPVGTAVSSLTSSSGVQAARASRPTIKKAPVVRCTGALYARLGRLPQVAHSLAPISATYGPVSPKSM